MTLTNEIRIKGSQTLNQMFEALTKTARGLQRDFGEIENLQRSLKGSTGFVEKAIQRIEAMILSDLQLVRPHAGVITTNVSKMGTQDEEFILSLSGADNFVRGISHFAISLALRVRGNVEIALIYSPIDDRLYYAEAGEGAYIFSPFHRQRMRVSERMDPADIFVGTDMLSHEQLKKIPFNHIRLTGCPALDMAWVAAGKFDALIMEQKNYAEIAAGDLIIRESNGLIISDDNGIICINTALKDTKF